MAGDDLRDLSNSKVAEASAFQRELHNTAAMIATVSDTPVVAKQEMPQTIPKEPLAIGDDILKKYQMRPALNDESSLSQFLHLPLPPYGPYNFDLGAGDYTAIYKERPWLLKPSTALGAFATCAVSYPGESMSRNRLGMAGLGMLAGYNAYQDYQRIQNADNAWGKTKYGIAGVADLAMVGGALVLAAVPELKPAQFTGAMSTVLGGVGVRAILDLVPDNMVKNRKKEDAPAPPSYKDHAFSIQGYSRR